MAAGAAEKPNMAEVQEQFKELQQEYYQNLLQEMKDDCETYKKATECHEYGKMLTEYFKRHKEGFAAYKMNCLEYNAGQSCHNAGNMLLKGVKDQQDNVVFARDVPLAVDYFHRACEGGTYPRSCVTIAKLMQYGKEVPKDYSKAFEYLTTGCKHDNTDSCFAKATAYLQGMGTDKDPTKAVPILETNCSRGHHRSCHNLGAMYYHGLGVEKDLNKFKQFNQKARIFRGQDLPYGPGGKPLINGPEGVGRL